MSYMSVLVSSEPGTFDAQHACNIFLWYISVLCVCVALHIYYIIFCTERRTYAVVLSCPREAWTPWRQLLTEFGLHSLLHPSLPSARAHCLWCYCRHWKPHRRPNWPEVNCSLLKQHSRTKKTQKQRKMNTNIKVMEKTYKCEMQSCVKKSSLQQSVRKMIDCAQ